VSQQLSERFGVMYAVRNVRAGAGDKAQEDLRTAIDWARTQLVGLQIDATATSWSSRAAISSTSRARSGSGSTASTTRDLRKV
jgi:hypothetical protein